MLEDAEIVTTDSLLVTRKKPPSLAKFLSTSNVFRHNVGQQQQEHDIAFVKNFGWAPQRFSSRARPLARESTRWDIIFKALGEESQGPDRDRRILARGFLEDLGGENSSRLFLGGCWPICSENTTLGSLQETKATPTLQQLKLGPPRSSQGWTLCSWRGRL